MSVALLTVEMAAAALFVTTAVLLIFSQRANGPAARWASLASILCVLGADYLLLRSYRGEKELNLERPGPFQNGGEESERGYFKYERRPSAGNATAGSASPGNTGSGTSASDRAATAKATPAPIKDCDECPELVVIAAGEYRIGAEIDDEYATPAEAPIWRGRMAKPFAIGRFEITYDQFSSFLEESGHHWTPCSELLASGRLPITCVSWEDARAYAAWLSAKTGKVYRLPNALEWEYAARGGVSGPYISGRTLSGANIQSASLMPVGSSSANAFGLFDVHGNVAELVADCWSTSIPDPSIIGAGSWCSSKMLKDADWRQEPEAARLSARKPINTLARLSGVGFRVARAK